MSKPQICVFSGPQSTVANSAPLITSNKARAAKGLPLLPSRCDALRLQRLAAPVEVLITQFSEHPLASDSAELHGDPDGYADPVLGTFSKEFKDGWVPCYKALLKPEDGLYALPFMGLTKEGKAWDGPCSEQGDRQTFFPDASRMYEEIERMGWDSEGRNCLLSSMASFDFVRACPPGGYTKGQSKSMRSDSGSQGDIPKEVAGVDFFRYYPYHLACPPHAEALVRATNAVQSTVATQQYDGFQWLESSCSIEETLYWLSLVVDTTKPIVGHSAQRPHGTIGNEGDHNVLAGAKYICSRIWEQNEKDVVGAVLVVDDQAYAARDVAKTDARPGNYAAVGGHGGIVAGLHLKPVLTFIPTRLATWRSMVNITRMPKTVPGLVQDVRVKNDKGELLLIPRVNIVKSGHYSASEPSTSTPFNGTRGLYASDDVAVPRDTAKLDQGVVAELRAAEQAPLAGMVAEGANPYAYLDENAIDAALLKVVFTGVPVCRVARGNTGGFCYPSGPHFIAGSNLTSTKARILLQAAILNLGMLPVPQDSHNPTLQERQAIAQKVAQYQAIFDSH